MTLTVLISFRASTAAFLCCWKSWCSRLAFIFCSQLVERLGSFTADARRAGSFQGRPDAWCTRYSEPGFGQRRRCRRARTLPRPTVLSLTRFWGGLGSVAEAGCSDVSMAVPSACACSTLCCEAQWKGARSKAFLWVHLLLETVHISLPLGLEAARSACSAPQVIQLCGLPLWRHRSGAFCRYLHDCGISVCHITPAKRSVSSSRGEQLKQTQNPKPYCTRFTSPFSFIRKQE